MDLFLKSFIPLFVAIDVLGVLPLFLGLTEGMATRPRRKLTGESVATAFAISCLFLLAGKWLFGFLGITEHDFKIGGGIVLLVLAVDDLLFAHDRRRGPNTTAGVVPIGIPLIMGPAALTTILISVDSFGYLITLGAIILNLGVVWAVFYFADAIARLIGQAGSRAIAKVASLFLAGIAVMMIRLGVTALLAR